MQVEKGTIVERKTAIPDRLQGGQHSDGTRTRSTGDFSDSAFNDGTSKHVLHLIFTRVTWGMEIKTKYIEFIKVCSFLFLLFAASQMRGKDIALSTLLLDIFSGLRTWLSPTSPRTAAVSDFPMAW